ncbi:MULTISPECIES: porin family protein [Shewanella]|uniref:Porin family protein n=1 Tax=Shewanella putrefaciens TaxID=24 RepID=A0ABX8XCV5_SHEPU|nr:MULTISPECIES: porin family protein [Shewanella]AVV84258.1 membrane protein [Shewanella putrefaciens]MCK7630706.1 porin family protein [Shewanella sp. JNE9-1]MCK7635237.1 porin family protein [Shewanella sp. JNE17]MCK7645959.1 porin family protein [Shewanella sp. JNE3-1]MCK7650427.1 porin family protein [Shewanella sp. JNE8]
MKKLSIVIISLLSTLVATQVSAETDKTGFYVGGAVNRVTLDALGDSESGTGFGVYGGYNFNEWFGLEANLFATGDLGDRNVDMSAGALSFTPKFTAQINDIFSVYAKVGIASMAVNVDGFGFDEDFTGFGWTYGAGINAAVTEHLNIRVSYDVTTGDLDADHSYVGIKDMDTDIKQFAVGVHYQF